MTILRFTGVRFPDDGHIDVVTANGRATYATLRLSRPKALELMGWLQDFCRPVPDIPAILVHPETLPADPRAPP